MRMLFFFPLPRMRITEGSGNQTKYSVKLVQKQQIKLTSGADRRQQYQETGDRRQDARCLWDSASCVCWSAAGLSPSHQSGLPVQEHVSAL